MDGPLAGGLAPPSRPRGPTPREDMDTDGGVEALAGDGGLYRSTHFLPLTKEGPRDTLDSRGGAADGHPHPGLREASPHASTDSHRISSCCWAGGGLDLRLCSPTPHLLGPLDDGGGPWEHPLAASGARNGLPWERRFEERMVAKARAEAPSPPGLWYPWSSPGLPEDDQGPQRPPRLPRWLPERPPAPPPLASFRTAPPPPPDAGVPPALQRETATWGALPRPAAEVATQTWTVNAEASVERLGPPYLCPGEPEDLPEEEDEEDGAQGDPAVFPCVECSIYFQQKEHLLEHMGQHQRVPGGGPEPLAQPAPLACGECGWAFWDPGALERHRRLHQASREKILGEIQKLEPSGQRRRGRRHPQLHEPPGLALGPRRASPDLGSCGLFPEAAESLLGGRRRAPRWGQEEEDGKEDAEDQPRGSRLAFPAFPAFPVEEEEEEEADCFGSATRVWWEKPPPGPGPYGWKPFTHSNPPLLLGPLGHPFPPRPPEDQQGGCPPDLEANLDRRSYLWIQGDEEEDGEDEEEEEEEEEEDTARRMQVAPINTGIGPPPAALELKRTFRAALRTAAASPGQRQQLLDSVPLVQLPRLRLPPRSAPRASVELEEEEEEEMLGLGAAHPLDLLLLDTPLGLDALLAGDPVAGLRPEERRCPYCPDRFHNGIGLANHVRGHLNRVGVSYNVRHFISAEDVKAIERRCSFQKKKKKVANFDPATFSLMRCDFCGAGFDTRAGLSSHARAHLRDFGITNWELTVSPINILQELLAASAADRPPSPLGCEPGGSPGGGSSGGGHHGGFLTSRRPRFPLVPFPPTWSEDPGPAYGDGLGLEEGTMVAVDVGLPPIPKKSLPLPGGPLEQVASRLSSKVAAEAAHSSKPELPDLKAQSLTTCEVCGACFETRKGLSSHARSHLRQLGVAESESSGAPIDLLYELVKQKGLPDAHLGLPPGLAKKTGSPKDALGPRPGLLALAKPLDVPSINKAIKSPPGFAAAAKGLAHPPASPLLKKTPLALAGSPGHKNPEDKSPQLSLSPRPASPKAPWPEDEGPLNLTSGPEPARDIRCEFCGEFFENRKGLSSHARSHLRQMGVTEWYVNGSPIDTLREILQRRAQAPRPPHPLPHAPPHPPAPGPKAPAKMGGPGPLDARGPAELHLSPLAKKPPPPGSPLTLAPAASPPPAARKMFAGLAPPLPRKLKPEHIRVEIKREVLHAEPGDDPWAAAREDLAPLNLSSRAEPVRDIRCEFCGEFFENRKGLSSHARSHLRQMGVTEWSVNGSPIDTLREILKKKTKPCLIKKEPPGVDLTPALEEEDGDGGPPALGPLPAVLPLAPLAGRPGKPGAGPGPRELLLAPLPGARPSSAAVAAASYLGPVGTKRPLADERLLPAEVKAKAYIQTELPFKAKALQEKAAHGSTEACCELCGLYFENRKALASHARAHLRQFGVTEWCVNGSPIETLSEWIRHRPQKAGAYRSYIQGGRPFAKKFRSAGHGRDTADKRPPPGPAPGGLALAGRGGTAGGPGGEPAALEFGRALDGGGGERTLAPGPPGAAVRAEEHQRQNVNKFERRQARPADTAAAVAHGGEEAVELRHKLEEARRPPPRVRPVPALVPRPPQTSLVKFVGDIYTLKCRFCEVQFQGPLSVQEEWVRHLQRHILEMNFSKADAPTPPEPLAPQAQTAGADAP